jgi:hypothetical protein
MVAAFWRPQVFWWSSFVTETYLYSWTCKDCGHENSIERSKHEAAFDHSPKLGPCAHCSGTEYTSAGFDIPEIDEELLEVWFADPTLFFLEQDEDLIIADTDLEVLKGFLEKSSSKVERAKSLGPILAVKLYDINFSNLEQRQWCVNWLVHNKDKWINSTNGYILKDIKPLLKKEFLNDQK